jgi:hypothetical protein
MQLGIHLRELWRLRLGLVLTLLLSIFAAVWVCYRIELSPPRLESRSLEMGTASTRVLVDTPKSTVLDLRQGTYDFESLSNRALLLGNVMAGLPVREYIARRARIPADVLRVSAPLTPEFPRAIEEAGNEKHTTDILRSTNQYRISLRTNPTVPMLDVYAQAPTAERAEALANAAVDGLQDYLDDIATTQRIDADQKVRLKQLGRARGAVINDGIRIQVALLSFLVVFAVSATAVLLAARVRRGWQIAGEMNDDIPPGGPDDLDDAGFARDFERVGAG